MYKHPIPRQITTFEFKLIGFLTLKQFLYLVIFFPLGYIFYVLTPIPYINILAGLSIASVGLAFAFLKIQERPLEIWLKNLLKSLSSPTIYIYKKHNLAPEYLEDITLSTSPTSEHLASRKHLKNYLSQKKPTQVKEKKGFISSLFFFKPEKPKKEPTSPQEKKEQTPPLNQPFLSGVVKSSKQVPLPGILVYIKDPEGNPVRLMKTNPHGVFATFKPLKDGAYTIEAYDPTGANTFDKMEIQVEGRVTYPIEIVAKSL